jgi:hypothetical protein
VIRGGFFLYGRRCADRSPERLTAGVQVVQTARAKLSREKQLSLDDFISLTKEAAMTRPYSYAEEQALFEPFYRKHLSAEQYEALVSPEVKARGLMRLGLTEAEYNEAWQSVIDDSTRLMQRGDDTSPEAQDVLRRSVRLSEVIVPTDDPALQWGVQVSLSDAFQNPSITAKSLISEDLRIFLSRIGLRNAMATLPALTDEPADKRPHPSDAAVRGLIERLARYGWCGETVPSITARFVKAQFNALGPLASLRHITSNEHTDVHRAYFAHGRLRCATRRDEAGHFTLVQLEPG